MGNRTDLGNLTFCLVLTCLPLEPHNFFYTPRCDPSLDLKHDFVCYKVIHRTGWIKISEIKQTMTLTISMVKKEIPKCGDFNARFSSVWFINSNKSHENYHLLIIYDSWTKFNNFLSLRLFRLRKKNFFI
jgi:hypothetical protein